MLLTLDKDHPMPRRTARSATTPAPEGQVAAAAPSLRVTKSATVLSLLQREDGATLAELIDATGWLPHTTRAALTGLRKKGHTIERGSRDGVTFYRVTAQ